jgi:hypothetical protein
MLNDLQYTCKLSVRGKTKLHLIIQLLQELKFSIQSKPIHHTALTAALGYFNVHGQPHTSTLLFTEAQQTVLFFPPTRPA